MRLGLKNMIVVTSFGVAAFFLWKFHPAKCGFFPSCPVLKHTGFYCSGCGSLRAIHYLLTGHLLAAWRMNPLTVLLLPGISFLACIELFFHQYQWANRIKPVYLWILMSIFILFGILRNIPLFACLAPH